MRRMRREDYEEDTIRVRVVNKCYIHVAIMPINN
jgi:hypothetical protein